MVVYIYIYEYMYTCIYINICIGKKNRYLHIFTLRMGPRVWEDLGCDVDKWDGKIGAKFLSKVQMAPRKLK